VFAELVCSDTAVLTCASLRCLKRVHVFENRASAACLCNLLHTNGQEQRRLVLRQ